MVDKIQQIDNHYFLTHKVIIADLTCNTGQFTSERIEKMVHNYKDNHAEARRGRTYQNIGYDLTVVITVIKIRILQDDLIAVMIRVF